MLKKEEVRRKIIETIKKLSKEGKVPYMSQLFWLTGFAETTIRRHLKELEREGAVKFVYKNGRKYVVLRRGYNGKNAFVSYLR